MFLKIILIYVSCKKKKKRKREAPVRPPRCLWATRAAPCRRCRRPLLRLSPASPLPEPVARCPVGGEDGGGATNFSFSCALSLLLTLTLTLPHLGRRRSPVAGEDVLLRIRRPFPWICCLHGLGEPLPSPLAMGLWAPDVACTAPLGADAELPCLPLTPS